MIFLPSSPMAREVCDPDVLADDFVEAARIAGRLTQWQFAEDAFPDPDVFGISGFPATDLASITFVEVEALLQTRSIAVTSEPILTGGGVTAGIWQVPYNRGFAEIGDGDVALTWTSEYPELVLSAFSFQYVRLDAADFTSPNLHIRTQVQVQWNGARMPGSGPFAMPPEGGYRGTGMGQRAVRSTVVTMQVLPAGNHRIAPVAGQQPAIIATSEELTDMAAYLTDPPVEGVCIGSRSHILLRFARGLPLTP